MQRHPDLSGHKPLGAGDVRVEVTAMAREPLSLVDQARVLLGNGGLEMGRFCLKRELFHCSVRRVEDDGGRGFVHLPGLDADVPVLDHVDPADPMAPTDLI